MRQNESKGKVKAVYRIFIRFIRFNIPILLLSCLLTGWAFGDESSLENKTGKAQEAIVNYVFSPIVERLGEGWVLTIIITICGLILYFVKDAISRSIDSGFSAITNFIGRFYGQDMGAYLDAVVDECKEIRAGFKIFGIDFSRDYISLRIQTGYMAQGVELKEVSEVLRENQRVVIRGQSGAGKSVLLKHLAISYANRQMKALHGKHLFPILGVLKNTCSSADLFSHLAQICKPYFKQHEDFLRAKLMAGDCIVFLDGFDEVPADMRDRTLIRIEDFASEFDQSQIVVTLRREGYEDVEFASLFLETKIAALSLPQIKTLTTSVLRANRGELTDQEIDVKSRRLLDEVRSNEHLQVLAENPMLLSIIAVVYQETGSLPDKALALYDRFIRLILDVQELTEGGICHRLKYHPDQKVKALQKIALYFVEEGMSQFTGEILRKELTMIKDDINLPIEESEVFIDELCKIGVLHRVPSLTDTYDFVHHSFLEYFAAREIRENRQEKESLIFDYAGDPNWRDVILLFVDLLGDSEKVVTNFMKRGYTTLAGECFLTVPIPDESIRRELIVSLLNQVNTESADKDQAQHVLADLVSLQSGDLADQQELQIFLEGQLNDPLARPKVKVAIYREKLCLELPKAQEFAARFGLVLIPEGKSIIGVESPRSLNSRNVKRSGVANRLQTEAPGLELPRQEIYLPAFFIDKFPVTNEQYAQFIDAGGYQDSKYWIDEGWELISSEHIKEPRYWRDPPWNLADKPVVGVSWFEASAYAMWAGKQLPTEAMWEKAARGTDERLYPWGNKVPDDVRANFGEHIGETTSVRKYAFAKSPYGVCDMSGNVWEWCDNWWDENKDKKVIRGGSWLDEPKDLEVTVRSGVDPWYWYNIVGFRCAMTS